MSMKQTKFDYIFYRFYDFLSIIKSYDIYFATIHLMSMLLGLNVLIILNYFSLIVSYRNFWEENMFVAALLYLIPVGVFYLTFLRKKRYLVILKQYEGESAKTKLIARVVVGFYIAMTIFLIF